MLARAALLAVLALALCGCSELKSARLLAPTWFGFNEIGGNVYMQTGATPDEQRAVFTAIDAARARIAAFFGEATARPRIFACPTEQCFTANGGLTSLGKTYGSSIVLLSPRGIDPVVIAHELTHAELHLRIGDVTAWRRIPAWFDEGLAVLVSGDPRYSETEWLFATNDGFSAPPLAALGAGTPWHYDNWQLSYGTARRAVGAWHAKVGNAGLARLIEALSEGASFDAALGAP